MNVGGCADEEYAWEKAYERTWDAIEEDEETGALITRGLDRRRTRQQPVLTSVQRGMLRHVFLIIDMSRGMDAGDFKPNRAEATVALAKEFVREYFDQNPISSMGVIVTRNAVAEKISDMSGNPRRHIDAIDAGCRTTGGDMTLQTSLDLAVKFLSLLPTYGTREVVLIHGAHATCDPGNINTTIAELQREKVRVSVISLPGELFISSRIAKETGGACTVPETYDDFRRALLDATRPPARRAEEGEARAQLVQMGFPTLVFEQPGLCACHCVLRPRGYLCPRCGSRSCEVPTKCVVCGLQLVSAPGLARSYHHLFAVPLFIEVPDARTPAEYRRASNISSSSSSSASSSSASAAAPRSSRKRRRGAASEAGGVSESKGGEEDGDADDDAMDEGEDGVASPAVGASEQQQHQQVIELVSDASTSCTGCTFPLRADQPRYVCPTCRGAFCPDCDAVIHETLHNCPGCCS